MTDYRNGQRVIVVAAELTGGLYKNGDVLTIGTRVRFGWAYFATTPDGVVVLVYPREIQSAPNLTSIRTVTSSAGRGGVSTLARTRRTGSTLSRTPFISH